MKRAVQVVLDTNVFVSALQSQHGASYKLLSLIDSGKFEINLSIPVFLEYESAAKRFLVKSKLTESDIDDILDYVLSCSNRHAIHYLWRPVLPDPKDEMILELAVAANCDLIVTHNIRDFRGSSDFGVDVIGPREFLRKIGEIK